MNIKHLKYLHRALAFLSCGMVLSFNSAAANDADAAYFQDCKLDEMYLLQCRTPSDINEHIPVLRELATECSTVAVIGVKPLNSTWGVMQGLSENAGQERKYLGIDPQSPDHSRLQFVQKVAEENGIDFSFWHLNDLEIDGEAFESVDMLFIDSLHTYCHLTYELETFSPKVKKYLCLHDTSEPYGFKDDDVYHGDYSEYPSSYDRTKRGLWPAICDFLERHPEWSLVERRTNNHGLTILQRK